MIMVLQYSCERYVGKRCMLTFYLSLAFIPAEHQGGGSTGCPVYHVSTLTSLRFKHSADGWDQTLIYPCAGAWPLSSLSVPGQIPSVTHFLEEPSDLDLTRVCVIGTPAAWTSHM